MQRRRSCNTKAAPLVSFALSHPFCYLSPSEHDVILRIHHCCACSFLFGWPPCQRSDMTLVEVSQHAYNCLFIRTIVLFVFLRNSCEPDMVLVYFCWINSVWVWVWPSFIQCRQRPHNQPMFTIFGHGWGDSLIIFTRDVITSENHWHAISCCQHANPVKTNIDRPIRHLG